MEEGKIWSNQTMTVATTTATVDFSSPTKPLDYTRVLKKVVLCSTVAIAVLVLYCASSYNFGQTSQTFIYGLKYNSSKSSNSSSEVHNNTTSQTFIYGLKYNSSKSSNSSSEVHNNTTSQTFIYELKYNSSESSNSSSEVHNNTVVIKDKYYDLRKVLKAAATEDNTVILTTLNEAWAAPNSVFDLFLESFKVGNDTARLLRHLVVIAVDDNAYERCVNTVSHCYFLKSNQSSQMAHEAVFMTPIYMDMMWGRLDFLQTILSLGYNFVFTDTDVMWFRSPFPQFIPSSDIQTSCDVFNGQQFNLSNFPNNGFVYVRSNPRTIKFYKFWVSSRYTYPGLHEQDVFNKIKDGPFAQAIQLRIRFLDTDYFGGYCSPSKDFSKVCTMHANCCIGLDRKIVDLHTTIEDWNNYFLHSNQSTSQTPSHWRVPNRCLG